MAMLGLFASALLLNAGVPAITVQMMRLAPQAPTMMGALNMAAFNIANAIGAVGGAQVLAAGWGDRSPILAGLGLTCVALALLALAFRRLTRD
jgi:DHA1 family inner membrane transport protein